MTKRPQQERNKTPLVVPKAVRSAIRRSLGEWYAGNRRDLPWRKTTDPYPVWISEVMLQQTQVKTVKPYYRRFLGRFPDVFSLARADLQDLLKMWEGLGYYSRARNMHKTANHIADRQGRFPDTWDAVRMLPGIGDYIASALMSISFNQPHAVVDGNVKRVLARLFILEWPVNKPAFHRSFKAVADQLLDHKHPGDHNQAVMELGALVCTPRNPQCRRCPVSKYCRALAADTVLSYPKRIKTAPLPQRHVVVGVVEKNGRLLFVQRPEQGLLGGLWEFPGGAVDGEEKTALICKRRIKAVVNLDVSVDRYLATVRHTYTHFKLRMDIYACRWLSGRIYLRGPADFKWLPLSRVSDLPLHGAVHKALRSLSG